MTTTLIIIEQQRTASLLNDPGRGYEDIPDSNKHKIMLTEDNRDLLTEANKNYVTED
jgi:hypothetical protein